MLGISRRGRLGRFGLRVALAAVMALSPTVGPAAGSDVLPPIEEGRAGDPAAPFGPFVTEAAARFGIPERWIRVVMQAESAGDPRAVSRAGAMGLMKVMPATWEELRADHGLGTDPFNPRDNILAGAAYLRAMLDRFGSPGFLAAYNAGPDRYARHLETGQPLPSETRAYLAKLAPLLGEVPANQRAPETPVQVADWREAPLFVSRAGRRTVLEPKAGFSTADHRASDPPITAPDASASSESPTVPSGSAGPR